MHRDLIAMTIYRKTIFALFRFEGSEVPQAIDILLVSRAQSQDTLLFKSLDDILGSKRMKMLTDGDLLPLLDFCPENHPIRELIDPELDLTLIEAVQGSLQHSQSCESAEFAGLPMMRLLQQSNC